MWGSRGRMIQGRGRDSGETLRREEWSEGQKKEKERGRRRVIQAV